MSLSRLVVLISVLCFMQSVSAELYKWKDEKGNIHFSDKPHADAQKLNIRTPKPSGIGVSKSRIERQKRLLDGFERKRQKRQKQEAKNRQQRAALENRCRRLKNRLLNYEEADFVFTRDSSGKKKRISSQQKKSEQARLRKQIADEC